MKIIKVGMYDCFVDDEDYEALNKSDWHITDGYAGRGKQGERMHHVILGGKPIWSKEVHHKNGNRLDNRKENLVILDKSTHRTANKKRRDSKSPYKGVRWEPRYNRPHGKWVANVSFKRQRIYVGTYDTPEEAARAYDKELRRWHGEHALTNFPVDSI